MIGEVTYSTGDTATATVQVTEPMHILRFNTDRLRVFVQKSDDIAAVLEQDLANHLRTKLVTMSKTASQKPAPDAAKPTAG